MKNSSTRTRKFVWDGEGQNAVSIDILCAPIAKGGKSVLHLKSRNEAIKLKWLKGLLAPLKERPQWALFAHDLLVKVAQTSPVVKPEAKTNTFLQTWSPSHNKPSAHLKCIIKTAKKYNVCWEAISIDPNIAKQLPAWFHIGTLHELNKLNNHLYATCLREKHRITSVGQIETIASRNSPLHRQNKNCLCIHCMQDRTISNCDKPFKCAKLAKDILKCILPKWCPQTSTHPYALNIAPEQITANDEDQNKKQLEIFNPTFPSPDSIESGFHAFITPNPPCTSSACQAPKPPSEPPHLTNIIITGMHQVDKDGTYVSGGGAWFS